MRSSLSRPPAAVSEEEPILTTMRRAAGISVRVRTVEGTSLFFHRAIVRGRICPMTGLPLRPQLLAGRCAGIHSIAVLLAALRRRATRRCFEPDVAAPRGKQFGSRVQRRLPVEDHATLHWADDDLVAGEGSGAHQAVLDAERGEPVGEVAHGLVI